MRISILIPVFNEKTTIQEIIRRVLNVDLGSLEKELIIVDDFSTDGTREILGKLTDPRCKVFFQDRNQGKGAAIRRALEVFSGDVVIIQDADLEYYPEEYPQLLDLILTGRADVVYGSRFMGRHRVFLYRHYLGNKLLTTLTNILCDTFLTDMETCYKAMRAEVARSLNLRSNRFNIEPEITVKIFRQRRWKVYEIPISYDGRGYEEGKKITWKDGISALWTLVRYRFFP